MTKKTVRIILIVIYVLVMGIVNLHAAPNKPEVLILHSYSPDYDWTEDIQKGIDSVLKPLGDQYQQRIEYMDTNHNLSYAYRQLLYSVYKEKYAHTKFSVILVSDNAALNFVRQYRDELFPETPIVFCGINGYVDSMLDGFPQVTGVAEEADFRGIFDTAFALYPNAQQLIVYGRTQDVSYANSGITVRKTIDQHYSNGKVSMRGFSTIEQMIEDIKTLPPDSLIFLEGNMMNSLGQGISLQQTVEIVSKAIDVPVFSSVDFTVGHGVLGGKVIRGFDQGQEAAKMMVSVLGGKPISQIPVIQKPAHVYKFDYKQMQRFHLTEKNLPKNSIIINSPESTYTVDRNVFWGVLFTLSILAGVVVLLIMNIRFRHKAETALAASEEKFFKAFRCCADVLGIAQLKDGCYVDISDAFFTIFDYKREEVIGYSNADINLWVDAHEYKDVYEKLSSGGSFRNQERHWRTKDGTIRIGLWSAEVIEIGSEPSIIFAWTDITELKKTQKELREAHDLLERKVENRTQELSDALNRLKATQSYLVQSEKMAALGSLVAGVAHEINTPVGVSVTAASYLEKTVKEFHDLCDTGELDLKQLNEYLDDFQESSTIIQTNLARAARLIKSFKQVSVDQSSEMRRVFNVKQYLDEVTLSIYPQMKKTLHTLSVQCDDDLEIDGYPGAFSQVITNLIFNSLLHAFNPNEAGKINIQIKRSGMMAEILYTDNGKGMEDSVLSHIFEPFFTTKRGSGGTGLGLYITYNIITQQFGGSVVCTSELGKGTTFILKLQLKKEDSDVAK